MTAITRYKDENGFFVATKDIEYNTPYTMIEKKPDKYGHRRIREVYDFRELNSLVELRNAHMKTVVDVTEHMAQRGLKTLADEANWFEQLPLPIDERKYVVITTPLGKRSMTAWSYGHKNAAPAGQFVINKVAAYIINALGWVDDIVIAHNPDMDTNGHLCHLERLFIINEQIGALLNPEKFWPFVDECEAIGYYYTQLYHRPTQAYKQKVWSFYLCDTITRPFVLSL